MEFGVLPLLLIKFFKKSKEWVGIEMAIDYHDENG